MIPSFLVGTATLLIGLVLAPASGPTVFTPAPGRPDRPEVQCVGDLSGGLGS